MPKMNYEERLARWVRDNDVQVGDKVRLTRCWSDGEHGFPYNVSGYMGVVEDRLSGKLPGTGQVKKITNEHIEVRFGEGCGTYPFFALELLDKQPAHEESYKEICERKFPVGTKVRIAQRWEHNRDGWGNAWTSEMNQYIGKETNVKEITDTGIITTVTWQKFPWQSLELVEDKPEQKRYGNWRDDWPIGAKVKVVGLKSLSDLNGKIGTIVGHTEHYIKADVPEYKPGPLTQPPVNFRLVDDPRLWFPAKGWDDLDYVDELQEVGLEINRKPLTIQPEPEQELRLKPRKKLKLNYTA